MSLSRKLFKSKTKMTPSSQNIQNQDPSSITSEHENILKLNTNPSLENNLSNLKKLLGESSDVIYRTFQLTAKRDIRVAVIYIDGLADSKIIQDFILESMNQKSEEKLKKSPMDDEFKVIKDFCISVGEVKTVYTLEDVSLSILSGDTAVLIDGYSEVIINGTRGWEDRGVTEPSSQNIVRGPKDGFSEHCERIQP